MYQNLHDIFDFNQLSTADRISLYNQWRPRLAAQGHAGALAHLERALAHDRATQAMEVTWKKGESKGHYPEETVALDARIDDLMVGIHDMAAAQRRALPADHALALAADRILDDAFPLGVGAVVNASYVEEAAEVERILTKLVGDRAADVAKLHLSELVTELAQVAREYRAAVDASRVRLDFADVRRAQQRGLSFLAELVVLVLARYYDSDNPAHVAERAHYLDAISVHEKRARARRRTKSADEEPDDGDIDGAGGDGSDTGGTDASSEATAATTSASGQAS